MAPGRHRSRPKTPLATRSPLRDQSPSASVSPLIPCGDVPVRRPDNPCWRHHDRPCSLSRRPASLRSLAWRCLRWHFMPPMGNSLLAPHSAEPLIREVAGRPARTRADLEVSSTSFCNFFMQATLLTSACSSVAHAAARRQPPRSGTHAVSVGHEVLHITGYSSLRTKPAGTTSGEVEQVMRGSYRPRPGFSDFGSVHGTALNVIEQRRDRRHFHEGRCAAGKIPSPAPLTRPVLTSSRKSCRRRWLKHLVRLAKEPLTRCALGLEDIGAVVHCEFWAGPRNSDGCRCPRP